MSWLSEALGSNPQRVDLAPATGALTGGGFGGIDSLSQYNLGGQNLGQYSSTMQNTINNPFAPQALAGAQGFGGLGMDSSVQGWQNSMNLGGMVNPLINTAFDPQNALYARTADQVSQQALAGLGNSGLAQTPWGQGVYGQTMGNFNIDWQNNQLQRELAGATGATNLAQGAAHLGAGSAMQGAQFAGLPYQTFQGQGQDQLSLLSGGAQYGNMSSAVPQTAIGDWLSYMGQATSANNAALAQQTQNFKQATQIGEAAGEAAGEALGMFV
jgi:hypothetical protein